MLRRKKSKWFETVSSAQSPIRFDKFSTQPERNSLISFLHEKIILKELEGYISHDQQKFIPKMYIFRKVMQLFNNSGIVDICEIIDRTGLSGEVIEPIILEAMQNSNGFFDLISRKFYSKTGAISTLNQILKKSSTYDLRYLLNQLYWSEDQLEAILDIMTSEGLFNGYIDPSRCRLYNFIHIDFSEESSENVSINAISRFIRTSFHLSKEVALIDLSHLTRLSKKDLESFLIKHKSNWSFVFSNNHDFLYSTLEILLQILLDIFIYKDIPLEFWKDRLDLDIENLYELLTSMNDELKGELTRRELKGISLTSWFKRGIDIEKLALKLHLSTLDLLKQIKYVGNVLGLKLIAGDTINPFLIRGEKEFEIFCQIDTSSHANPSLYFECQNCRRIMCSNCREIESTHECPFCGNISAFIVDLPRYCSDCQITYTHSYNLETAEECYFCKKGPLKSGWYLSSVKSVSFSTLENDIESYITNSDVSSLNLAQIITQLRQPSDEVIKMLERLILNSRIIGKIDIKKMRIDLSTDKSKTNCEICGKRSKRKKYICTSCKIDVCITCYSGMEAVGMIACPECGNNLELLLI